MRVETKSLQTLGHSYSDVVTALTWVLALARLSHPTSHFSQRPLTRWNDFIYLRLDDFELTQVRCSHDWARDPDRNERTLLSL